MSQSALAEQFLPESPAPDEPGGEQPFVYDEELPNMVSVFESHKEGRESLEKISRRVRDCYDKWHEQTERRRREMRMFMRLLTGQLPAKPPPFDQVANAHIPILIQNLSTLLARQQSEIFSDWKNVFGVTPTGPDDAEIADILSLHGNYQFREEIIDFPCQIQRAELAYMFGTFRMHSFYDTYNRRNCHEALTDDDLVTPYSYTSTTPDMSDVPAKILILRKQRHELQQMRRDWAHVDDVLEKSKPSWSDDGADMDTIRIGIAKAQGIQEPDDAWDVAPYRLLHWEGWMELPAQQADRYVKAIVDYRTGHVMQLSIHEEVDWRERIRFERETQEASAYASERASYQAEMLAYEGFAQESLGRDDLEGAQAILGAMESAQEPRRPGWMLADDDRPSKARKVPINMFVQGNCIELIVGTHGVGPGTYCGAYQRAGNELMSRYLDQASIANCPSLLTTSNVQFKSPFMVAPARVNVVDGIDGAGLQTEIRELNFPPANQQLLDGVDRMQDYGRQAAQVADIILGESGKSGEAYRGQLARLEQATKNLSSFARNFARPLKYVYKNNAILNAKFMDDYVPLYLFNDKVGAWQSLQVGRAMYERQYRVEIHSDLKFTAEAQRISDADEVYTMVQGNPILALNKALQYQVIADVWKARGKEKYLPYLGEPPPPPPQFGIELQQAQSAQAQQGAPS